MHPLKHPKASKNHSPSSRQPPILHTLRAPQRTQNADNQRGAAVCLRHCQLMVLPTHFFQATRLKMLSEGPLGSEIAPLRSLLGPLWHHLGPNLVPFGSKMAPPGTPWVPQVTAKAPQSRSFWHKSSPEGLQGRPGCSPAPHFARFSWIWEVSSEGFEVPFEMT